jgi:hypothetical protein
MSGGRGQGAKGQGRIDLDGLYQIPLAEFTPARNALVTRLKKAGKADEAARVKGLIKPSVSAWAVNQLFWHHRAAFDALIAIGERFRRAQAAQIKGDSADLRGPLEERRESLATLSKLAASILRGAGLNATPEVMRRITSTLEALSVSSSLPDTPRAGWLVDDVDPPGFEALAALVPRVADDDQPPGPSRVLNFRQQQRPAKVPARVKTDGEARQARLKDATVAVQQAERGLRDARAEAERAEDGLKQAARQSKDADRARADAEKQLEKATADAETARQRARKVAASAEEAAQAVADAERVLEKARAELDRLSE